MNQGLRDLLEAMSYFLGGTFFLQTINNAKITFSKTVSTTLKYTAYGFILIGVFLALMSLPYPAKKFREFHDNLSIWLIDILFVVTLGAVVVTGLPINVPLTLVIFYLVFISYMWLTFTFIEPVMKKKMSSTKGIGQTIGILGLSLLYFRLVEWIFKVKENFNFGFLILGIILTVIGIMFLVANRIKNHQLSVREKKENKIGTESKPSSSIMLGDEPIKVLEQDLLNRKDFAKHFAETLIKYDDPSCLITALYGTWGSGKSSLLNLIEDNLRKVSASQSDYIIIRFNPWSIVNLDQLIASFFQELKVAVQNTNDKNSKENTIKLLTVFGGILSVGQLSPVGSQYFSMGAEAIGKMMSTIEEYQNKSTDQIKKQLDALLGVTAKRIFILIDDVDRLDQDAVRLLFRMIRLNADFKNTTYILSFDPKIVGELLDVEQPGHGKEYLEKIIQLPINIPTVDQLILNEILLKELNDRIVVPNSGKFDSLLWQNLITFGEFTKYFKTMRDVKRYINGLNVNYPPMANDVNMIDFMALEVLRTFAAESYDLIRCNKEVLTRLNSSGLPNQNENKPATEKILDEIFNAELLDITKADNKKKVEIVKATCRFLFPQLDRIYSNYVYRYDNEQKWREQKRICAHEIFENYFLLGIPKGEISDQQMREVLMHSNNSVDFANRLKEIFESKLGIRFLGRCEDYLDQVRDPLAVITALFEIEDNIIVQQSGTMMVNADIMVFNIIYSLLKRIPDKDQRKDTIKNGIKNTSKIYLPVFFTLWLEPEGAKQNLNNSILQGLDLLETDWNDIKTTCITKIKISVESGQLSKCSRLQVILTAWLRWGVEEEVQQYVDKLIEKADGVLDLLIGFSKEVHINQDRHLVIDPREVAGFLDTEILRNKFNELKPNMENLTDEQKAAIAIFISRK